jgi:hypothetical protein
MVIVIQNLVVVLLILSWNVGYVKERFFNLFLYTKFWENQEQEPINKVSFA